MKIASILFPLPLPEPFDYAIPDGMDVEPGSYVRAPLGKIERTGATLQAQLRPHACMLAALTNCGPAAQED